LIRCQESVVGHEGTTVSVGRVGLGWGSRDRPVAMERAKRPLRAVAAAAGGWVMALRPRYTPHNHWVCVKQVLQQADAQFTDHSPVVGC